MSVTKLLIANRGEIAIRIARAAADLGLPTVAVASEDDTRSLHLRVADAVRTLPGQGAAAYLDAEAVVAAATASGCDAIHPGYGFLAERGDFARSCAEAGLTFVGPNVEHLELFGDKARARAAAQAASVPVLRGLDHAVTLNEARDFFASLGAGSAMIIKALAGGGGRGTRLFNVGANMTAPLFTVIVRKAYGLGAQAMCGAGTMVGFFAVAWPTAEFAGMNIEGAVKLGYRKELLAIEDPEARLAEFRRMTEAAYDSAKAVNAAAGGGIDDVINPADTRDWIVKGLAHLPPLAPRSGKKYPYIDPW